MLFTNPQALLLLTLAFSGISQGRPVASSSAANTLAVAGSQPSPYAIIEKRAESRLIPSELPTALQDYTRSLNELNAFVTRHKLGKLAWSNMEFDRKEWKQTVTIQGRKYTGTSTHMKDVMNKTAGVALEGEKNRHATNKTLRKELRNYKDIYEA